MPLPLTCILICEIRSSDDICGRHSRARGLRRGEAPTRGPFFSSPHEGTGKGQYYHTTSNLRFQSSSTRRSALSTAQTTIWRSDFHRIPAGCRQNTLIRRTAEASPPLHLNKKLHNAHAHTRGLRGIARHDSHHTRCRVSISLDTTSQPNVGLSVRPLKMTQYMETVHWPASTGCHTSRMHEMVVSHDLKSS